MKGRRRRYIKSRLRFKSRLRRRRRSRSIWVRRLSLKRRRSMFRLMLILRNFLRSKIWKLRSQMPSPNPRLSLLSRTNFRKRLTRDQPKSTMFIRST